MDRFGIRPLCPFIQCTLDFIRTTIPKAHQVQRVAIDYFVIAFEELNEFDRDNTDDRNERDES